MLGTKAATQTLAAFVNAARLPDAQTVNRAALYRLTREEHVDPWDTTIAWHGYAYDDAGNREEKEFDGVGGSDRRCGHRPWDCFVLLWAFSPVPVCSRQRIGTGKEAGGDGLLRQ